MITKYVYGNPFETEAVVEEITAVRGCASIDTSTDMSTDTSTDTSTAKSTSVYTCGFGTVSTDNGFRYSYEMGPKDKVYGLGENVRGINKRGFEYISYCMDTPSHHEDTKSLYGAHNFIVVSGEKNFGLFFDYPTKLTFDIGYHSRDMLNVTCEKADLYLYVITGDSVYDIVKQFRKIIGRSYVPPKFSFGFGQSRWGYQSEEDFRLVVEKHREHHVPIDMVYLDIDYMKDFKDFTTNEEMFADFPKMVSDMKEEHIHLVPIIDAGVKVEEGYDIYEEGVKGDYFCKREDGSNFVGTVWPGETHFPDVLNRKAREWFGDKYKILLDMGIDGFWNDMNEPAIFQTPEGLERIRAILEDYLKNQQTASPFLLMDVSQSLKNSDDDYQNFYHDVNGTRVNHRDVHNLYGYNMTRAAGEAFERLRPEERVFIFSRSSYVGMHRYGGMWMGDNSSWWSHILMNLKMLPSLNMVGILYTGADLGGFGSNGSRDLLLRWLALGVFTPLMRNHSALGTREQEFYQFEDVQDFAHVIGVRYRLLPYLYSEYMKAVLGDEMMFRPLAFVYPTDSIACDIEDQLMLGDEVMIAPVYNQNAEGRFVYLPERMKLVKFVPDSAKECASDGSKEFIKDDAKGFIKDDAKEFIKDGIYEEVLEAGVHYIQVALNEVPLFIREGKCIPIVPVAEYVEAIDMTAMKLIGFEGATYNLYEDDGIHKDYENPKNMKTYKM